MHCEDIGCLEHGEMGIEGMVSPPVSRIRLGLQLPTDDARAEYGRCSDYWTTQVVSIAAPASTRNGGGRRREVRELMGGSAITETDHP